MQDIEEIGNVIGGRTMIEWKRIRNIRKDSYREEKGVEPWVPLFEAKAQIDRLEAELKSSDDQLKKMTVAHGLLNTQGLEQFDKLVKERAIRLSLEELNKVPFQGWNDGDEEEYFTGTAKDQITKELKKEEQTRKY